MKFIYDENENESGESSNRALPEFLSLFTMQSHTGFFGFLLFASWLGVASYSIPNFWSNVIEFPVLEIVLLCLPILLAWLSSFLQSRITNKVISYNAQGKDIDLKTITKDDLSPRNIRWQIAILSLLYILWCSVLIWLTGGSLSPFTPFYVMIFTLTLAQMKVKISGKPTFLIFSACILAACFLPDYFGWTIGGSALQKMQESNVHRNMMSVFLWASLAVPFISAWLVENKKKD